MATKTELETLIVTNLADSSDILAEEHREVEQAFVDELYASTVTEDNTQNTIFVKLSTAIQREISVTKRGNDVHVFGKIRNISEYIIGLTDLIQITDSKYFPDNPSALILQRYPLGVDKSLILTETNTIYLSGFLGAGESIFFNFNYKTND